MGRRRNNRVTGCRFTGIAMEKSRLEAFSDGVFAIVITLLILDIRIPEVDYAHLGAALREVLPRILAYAVSFIIIGLYWVSHHNAMQPIRKIDRNFLWMNILLLLFVSFIPFPTSLLGRYPFRALPIMIYGLTLVACNAVGFSMQWYVRHHPHLAIPDYARIIFRPQVTVYATVNGLYLLAVALAPVEPLISYGIYGCVVLFLAFFLTRLKSHKHLAGSDGAVVNPRPADP
jgi:uncharacterized membrane protein